jgi:hypothetical protein
MADAALEKAQSLCERGAHQFLREGDCEAEIVGAKESFEEVKRLSDQELIRLRAEQDIKQQEQDPIEVEDNPDTNPNLSLEADSDVSNEDAEDIMLNLSRYGIRTTRMMGRT